MSGGERALEGHFACRPELLVTQDCLGASYQPTVSGIPMTVTLPDLSSDRTESLLVAPRWSFAFDQASPGPGWEWGTIIPARDSGTAAPVYAQIARCRVFATVLADTDEQFAAAGRHLGDDLAQWWERVIGQVEALATPIPVAAEGNRSTSDAATFQYWGSNDQGEPVNGANYQPMYTDRPQVSAVGNETLIECMRLAGPSA